MSFFKYILTPRLYKVYRDGTTQVLELVVIKL